MTYGLKCAIFIVEKLLPFKRFSDLKKLFFAKRKYDHVLLSLPMEGMKSVTSCEFSIHQIEDQHNQSILFQQINKGTAFHNISLSDNDKGKGAIEKNFNKSTVKEMIYDVMFLDSLLALSALIVAA